MKRNIIIPTDLKPRPKLHEESAAVILSKHFDSDVCFIVATGRSTPDVRIGDTEWEIKSPIGNGRHNIQKNMRGAGLQSRNIVVDLRRSKLHQARALGYINQFVGHDKNLKQVIVITKNGKVLTIK